MCNYQKGFNIGVLSAMEQAIEPTLAREPTLRRKIAV